MIDLMSNGLKSSHKLVGGFDNYKFGIAYTARNNNVYAGFL